MRKLDSLAVLSQYDRRGGHCQLRHERRRGVLPDSQFGLTIANAAAPAYGLNVGLAWWTPGIVLAIAYFVFMYRRFAGKARLPEEGY